MFRIDAGKKAEMFTVNELRRFKSLKYHTLVVERPNHDGLYVPVLSLLLAGLLARVGLHMNFIVRSVLPCAWLASLVARTY